MAKNNNSIVYGTRLFNCTSLTNFPSNNNDDNNKYSHQFNFSDQSDSVMDNDSDSSQHHITNIDNNMNDSDDSFTYHNNLFKKTIQHITDDNNIDSYNSDSIDAKFELNNLKSQMKTNKNH